MRWLFRGTAQWHYDRTPASFGCISSMIEYPGLRNSQGAEMEEGRFLLLAKGMNIPQVEMMECALLTF